MDRYITSSRPLKTHFEDNEFETDNPEPSNREHESDIQIQDLSSIINPTIDKKQNYLLDGKFLKIISNTGLKISVIYLNCSKQIISGSTGNLLSHYKVSLISKFFKYVLFY